MKKNVDQQKASNLLKTDAAHNQTPPNQLIKNNKKSYISLFFKRSLSIFLILFTFSVFSQEKLDETFKIISNPTNENLDNYIIALNTSNFECFRFETKSRILVFKSGVTIEFFSYKQVTESGHAQDNNCFIADNVIVKEYELELVGNKIAILAPYDQSVKRAVK